MPNYINLEPVYLSATEPTTPLPTDPHGFLPYNRRIRATKNAILQYSSCAKGLAIYYYPIAGLNRVPPDELHAYFATHECRGPCCLCASQDTAPNAYTEAAIFQVAGSRNGLTGEWVIACARGRCKYWILLDRLWNKLGIPVRRYPTRSLNNIAPPPVRYQAENGDNLPTPSPPPRIGVRRRRNDSSDTELSSPVRPARRGRAIATSIIPRVTPTLIEEHPFRFLLQMDSSVDSGITEQELLQVFRFCLGCRRYMTSRAFRLHSCGSTSNSQSVLNMIDTTEVIDLTGDD
ncbi:hypothetical protein EYR40_011130 [Pleurotus pulmonarius]|nr:hypothetical protein EYR36_002900 [Pleurotus pulmonarius]KAF4587109.1 hypothetical protein EYR40_011130 [Pleurotus pulmonarius]